MKQERLYNNNNSIKLEDPTGVMFATCQAFTVGAVAPHVSYAIDFYQRLLQVQQQNVNNNNDDMIDYNSAIQPKSIQRVTGTTANLWDVHVAPQGMKETLVYGTRKDRLRVFGHDDETNHQEPKRTVDPYRKQTEIIAVLGAGNYSGAKELIQALFYNNSVAVHKPHPLNANTDQIWANRIFKPLVEVGALSFVGPDDGQALTTHPKVDRIYFTGGVPSAKQIQSATTIPIVCEAGGVNPIMIVPGEREWTDKELAHHAISLVSAGKYNGGHVCARPQVLVTCQNWSQRQAFLQHMEQAIVHTTFAFDSYYPSSDQTYQQFAKVYGDKGQFLQPTDSDRTTSRVFWVPNDTPGGYGSKNEAFCQVFIEVPLDTAPTAAEFLPQATTYCNDQVTGTLLTGVIIDEVTKDKYQEILDQTITDLHFGLIGINTWAGAAFLSPYLYWGGNDQPGQPLTSGNSDMGNLFGFERPEKTIVEDDFVSLGAFKFENKACTAHLLDRLVKFNIYQSWWNLLQLMASAIRGMMYSKDW